MSAGRTEPDRAFFCDAECKIMPLTLHSNTQDHLRASPRDEIPRSSSTDHVKARASALSSLVAVDESSGPLRQLKTSCVSAPFAPISPPILLYQVKLSRRN